MSLDLDPQDTRQDDLHGGRSPWGRGTDAPIRQPLRDSMKTEVLVVGAGITGALVAQHLISRGFEVAIIDNERPAYGSTAASTAMLQWEIDQPLNALTEIYGFDQAAAIYRRSLAAMTGLTRLVAQRGIACAFRPRETLYLAAEDVGHPALAQEFALRRKAGLPGLLLDRAGLKDRFRIERDGAILSPGSADADPMLLAWGMLRDAMSGGARLIEARAMNYDCSSSAAFVGTEEGHVIEAKHIVLATGYVMPDFVKADIHKTVSSWAIATVPQEESALWPGGALIWEASESYHYLRTLADGRIVIGGGDEAVVEQDERDAKMAEKREHLVETLAGLWPAARREVAFSWSGAFGQTEDGLPLIGRVPGMPRILAAYGYGGNGITFSFMASRMLAELCAGEAEDWFDTFAIDRPSV